MAASPQLQSFLEQENVRMQMQQTVAKITEVCWDKCMGNSLPTAVRLHFVEDGQHANSITWTLSYFLVNCVNLNVFVACEAACR